MSIATTEKPKRHVQSRAQIAPRPAGPSIDFWVREFELGDGVRKISIDKRAIGFVCPDRTREGVTIIAFRSQTKGVPVRAPYEDVRTWWMTSPGGRTNAA